MEVINESESSIHIVKLIFRLCNGGNRDGDGGTGGGRCIQFDFILRWKKSVFVVDAFSYRRRAAIMYEEVSNL